MPHAAPAPAHGSYADGFAPLARVFADQIAHKQEIGAGLAIFHRGELVVDLWGGTADVATKRAWSRDTRLCVFSVTKGLAAIALHLLADRGQLEWDGPVATYWPGFARAGKDAMSVRTLLGHRGGLAFLDHKLDLSATIDPRRRDEVRDALEAQRPAWTIGEGQGYHAITFGMYAKELFERVAKEPMGAFLQRELFDPLGSDATLGTPAALDPDVATLYSPSHGVRVAKTVVSSLLFPQSTEAKVARASIAKDSIGRRAFLNPHVDLPGGITAYNSTAVRRADLPWASATATARGIASAYLPFASRGEHAGRRYLKESTVRGAYGRDGWSERDLVLQKPLGWTNGFLKEERHVFSPTPESFGHAGMGGALGWCDPVHELTIGYVMNRMDFRVRSPRALALCHALYECAPIRDAKP
ncbi:MAG: beta-lactamase family protein [Deltaproteobacteria bacterium]|nr:beta-lactamase family protein [Deltaproteobacteria bacterium]